MFKLMFKKYLQFLTKLIQIFSSDVLPCYGPLDDAFFYNFYHRHHTYRGVRQCVSNCDALYLTHARNNGRKNYNGISSPGPSVPSSINLSLKKIHKKTKLELISKWHAIKSAFEPSPGFIIMFYYVLLLYIPSQQLWSWRDGQFT